MKSQTIELLKSFSVPELEEFGKFLNSSYFNTNKSVTALFELLRQTKFEPEMLTDRNVCPTGSSTIRRLYHTLHRLACRFLTIRALENNPVVGYDLLIHELLNRKTDKSCRIALRKFLENLPPEKPYDREMYLHKYRLETHKYDFFEQTKKITKKKIAGQHLYSLFESELCLTAYFITQLIFGYLNVQIYEWSFNVPLKDSITAKIISFLNIDQMLEYLETEMNDEPLPRLYHALLKAYMKFDDERFYFKYKNLLSRLQAKLSVPETSFHYSRLNNYCNLKERVNAGPPPKSRARRSGVAALPRLDKENLPDCFDAKLEMVDLHDRMLTGGFYKNANGVLDIETCRAILYNAVRTGRLTWLKNFLEQHVDKVQEDDRSDMLDLGTALYYFAMKQFDKSLEHISRIKSSHHDIKYDVRVLEIKNLFELSSWDALFQKLTAYRQAVSNDRLLESRIRMQHKRFVHAVELLAHYKDGHPKKNWINALERLMREDTVFRVGWLGEKWQEVRHNSSPV